MNVCAANKAEQRGDRDPVAHYRTLRAGSKKPKPEMFARDDSVSSWGRWGNEVNHLAERCRDKPSAGKRANDSGRGGGR